MTEYIAFALALILAAERVWMLSAGYRAKAREASATASTEAGKDATARRIEEVDAIKDLRESLRQRVRDQDEIIDRLDTRVERLEGELETARVEREKYSLERLERSQREAEKDAATQRGEEECRARILALEELLRKGEYQEWLETKKFDNGETK